MKSYAVVKMFCEWLELHLINVDAVLKNCSYFLDWTILNLLNCDDSYIIIVEWLQIIIILTVKITHFF